MAVLQKLTGTRWVSGAKERSARATVQDADVLGVAGVIGAGVTSSSLSLAWACIVAASHATGV